MKSCLSLLLLLCVAGTSLSQQVTIAGFTVKRELPGAISEWKADAVNAIIQASSVPGAAPKQVKIIMQVRKGQSMVCGNNAQSAQVIDNLTNKVIRTTDVSAVLGNCILQSGQYSFCIQVLNADNRAIAEQCREFTVPNVFDESAFRPPTLVAPANNAEIKAADFRRPLTFRWTPVVPPPPGGDVKYFLRVYEIAPGQQVQQALAGNTPVFEREVNTTQAVWQPPSEYSARKENIQFAWRVQATNRDGKGYGANNGTSEPFTFMVMNTYSIDLQNLQVKCPVQNKYDFTITVGNPNGSVAIFDKLEVVMINNTLISPINIPITTPPIGSTIPANGSINVAASFNYATPVSTVCVKAYIKEQANPTLNTASTFVCDTLQCPCDPCRDLGVTLKNDTIKTLNNVSNEIILTGMLNGLDPNKISRVTIELVYFNMTQTGDRECAKCATNKEWGNFVPPGSNAFPGFGNGVLNGNNFGRLWTWISSIKKDCDDKGGGTGHPDDPTDHPDKANNKMGVPVIVQPPPISKNNSFTLPIAVPPGNSLWCCGDKIKVCIRYTWWDFCCKACDVVKCYEIERKKPTTKP